MKETLRKYGLPTAAISPTEGCSDPAMTRIHLTTVRIACTYFS